MMNLYSGATLAKYWMRRLMRDGSPVAVGPVSFPEILDRARLDAGQRDDVRLLAPGEYTDVDGWRVTRLGGAR
jgi:hypothetical protein